MVQSTRLAFITFHMTTLREIITKVQEKNLSKDQLEEYHSDIVNIYALFQLEIAEIRKEKALYWLDNPEKTDKGTERKWQVTNSGLREIELSHWIKATEKLLQSLKARLYSVY